MSKPAKSILMELWGYAPIIILIIVVTIIAMMIKIPDLEEAKEASVEFKENEPSISKPLGYNKCSR